jgi:polar amino acid transport system substrate-binding protein
LASLGCLIGVLAGAASAQSPILLTADERPPFHSTSSDGQMTGVATAIVDCAMKSLNRPYTVTMLPWKRAQRGVKEGIYHGFFSASHNAERDTYATLSAIIADQYWNWYSKKDSGVDPTSDEFKGTAKVASWLGSNSQKWLGDSGYEPAPPSAEVDALLVRLLMGELDAVFGSNFFIEEAVKESGAEDKLSATRGPHKPMGVYFSNAFLAEYPEFLDQFNGAVESCS